MKGKDKGLERQLERQHERNWKGKLENSMKGKDRRLERKGNMKGQDTSCLNAGLLRFVCYFGVHMPARIKFVQEHRLQCSDLMKISRVKVA